jgi:hypothetical protein
MNSRPFFLHRWFQVIAFAAALALASAADATTLTVTNNTDDPVTPAAGSLRRVIADSISGDTIQFAPEVNGAIILGGTEIALDKSLAIEGPGAANLAISANGLSRIFSVSANVTVALSGLTMRDGQAAAGLDGADGDQVSSYNGHPGVAGGDGGAILNAGNLAIENCHFSSNHAGQGGVGGNGTPNPTTYNGVGGRGGIGGSGGAIFQNAGRLSALNCVFEDNHAGVGGWPGTTASTNTFIDPSVRPRGGLGGDGGAISSRSSENPSQQPENFAVFLAGCLFQSNSAGEGGSGTHFGGHGGTGGNGGAVSLANGEGIIEGTTFSNNQGGSGGSVLVVGVGGGSGGSGGAIALLSGTLRVNLSTLHNNQAGSGGFTEFWQTGLPPVGGNGGGAYSAGNLFLTSCTISGNRSGGPGSPGPSETPQPGMGGGIAQQGGGAAKIYLRNSIVATNSGTTNSLFYSDLYATVTSLGHNLIGILDGGAGIVSGTNGDLAGSKTTPLDPRLGALGNNGGLTPTQALLANSPASEAGDDALTGTDQRGLPRLHGSHVDIGAFEGQTNGFFEFSAAAGTIAENGGSYTLTVSRTGILEGSASVHYRTTTGTAGSNDFTSTEGTLDFASGVTTQSIIIPITNDDLSEPDESFTVTLEGTETGSLGTVIEHVVTIAANDVGIFAFAVPTTSVNEDAGVIQVVVQRSGGTGSPMSVAYSPSSGTATAGSDFVLADGVLNFAAGETEKSIAVAIGNDPDIELTEAFTITLANPVGGAVLGATSMHTVSIDSEDGRGQIAFGSAASTVAETAGTATISVLRSGALTNPMSVNYATASGSATAGSDFTTTSGTLTFAPGETEKQIAVPITNDADLENDETFTVTLSGAGITGDAVLGTQKTHTVTIQSEDQILLSFENSEAATGETGGGILVNVRRTGILDGTVSVAYATAGGTATSGVDFSPVSGTLTFPSGNALQTIFIPVADDPNTEPSETFSVALSSPAGGAILGAAPTLTVTVTDNDPTPLAMKAGFHGLASRVDAEDLGGLKVNTTARHGITGTLQIAGHTYRLNGRLGDAGEITKTFKVRTGGQTVQRTLNLKVGNGGKKIFGTFEFETGVHYDITADRDVVTTRQAPLPSAARYNAMLGAESPAALHGFLVANVRPTGSVALSATLPDGKTVTATAHVSEEGGLAIFIPSYAGKVGYLAGQAQITSGQNLPLEATLSWKKPPFAAETVPVALNLAGAPYTARTSNIRILDDFEATGGAGEVRLSEGGLSGSLSSAFLLMPSNKTFVPPTLLQLRLSVRPTTGVFTGSFVHPDGKRHAFTGLCIQQTGETPDIAEGLFKNPTAPGLVELLPAAH